MSVDTATCLLGLSNSANCLANGGSCRVRNATSFCACPSGKTGADCDQLIQPLVGIYIFDGIFYFLVFALWVFLARRRYKQTKGMDYDRARLKGVLPSHPKYFGTKLIILYRFVVFGFVFGVHISELVFGAPATYRFYTVWNFINVVMYFGLGLGLSIYAERYGADAIRRSKYMTFNATLHYVLLEIELPNTIMYVQFALRMKSEETNKCFLLNSVDVVFWAILFPSCAAFNGPANCAGFSGFIQHLANFFFMSIDFALTRHAFDWRHFPLNLAMPTMYAIFHLFYTIANDAYGHQPVYFFLDASSPVQPAWIFGVLVLHVGVFFGVWAFSTYVMGRKLNQSFDEKDDKKSLITAESSTNPQFQDA